MTDNINAEIIAIGTEILLGEITDTNSVYMAKQLRELGINVYYMTSVGDNLKRIADAIQIAMSRADIIITCGGLGPTVDDVTRQAVADATNRDLVFDQELYQQIEARFSTYKVKMTENNRRQAYLPTHAIPIENPVGTAPCFIVEHERKIVMSLPGVPREMKFLMQEQVMPYLREKYSLGIIKSYTLKTAGIGESSLDTIIGTELLEHANPSIGLAAHHGIIDIRITAKADNEALADIMLGEMEQKVLEKAGQFIFGRNDEQLEQVLLDFMKQHQLQLAVAEAGIGDAVIFRLNEAGGRAGIFSETLIESHPDKLRSQFNGASEMNLQDFAHHVAETIARRNPTQAGIAIFSLPDIDENADIDYATVVAIYYDGELKSRVYGFGGMNELARHWASTWSLAYLWRQLKETYEQLD
jgi:nicotinamide-nucleotide amidase